MASNSALVVSDLDFDSIRSNLSSYLQSQVQFKDYDFEGSNIGVLLDILSYNTHINNFYTNMAISESFLDSAQVRDSVVSRAKELNYTPRSYRSAVAYIDIQISPTTAPATITIPKGTAFNSRIDNNVYTFTTDQPYIVTAADNYATSNVAIYEGTYVTESFAVNSAIENQRFILNTTNIDTSSMYITVQNSSTDTTNSEFIQATSLLGYDSNSKIFFVQAADKLRYEIVFGDGNVGVAPVNGNVINVSYRISRGAAPNGSTTFSPSSTISGYATSLITITTNQAAYGGSEQESISSIKFNAPRHYQTQERAVTVNDYKTILFLKYPDIRAINVYGGEQLDPPQYGKVYLSIDFKEFDGIPQLVGDEITAFIKTKAPLSIIPVVVSADYTYIDAVISVNYNLNSTTKNAGEIEAVIQNAVSAFNTAYLDNFSVTFRYSKLLATIDEADSSITSINVNTRIIKKISPVLNTATVYIIDYQNPITEKTLISTYFTYNNNTCYLIDNGAGEIAIATKINDVEQIIVHNIGFINYITGKISINFPAIQAYTGTAINIYVESAKSDFSSVKNTILSILPEDVSVTAIPIRQ
jgi:hypothetical protein